MVKRDFNKIVLIHSQINLTYYLTLKMSKFSRNLISALTSPDPQLDPGILTKTSQIQIFYGAWVNMAQLAIGLAFGFASIQIPMLLKPDSAIQITVVDASWIVSSVSLLVPVGCMISGFVMDWAGRRNTLIICQVPMFVGWLYTAVAETANDIIIARAITGVGCGMAMGPSRAYGTEIALPNIRGVIGAFPNLALSLGITFTAALGKFFTWQFVCYVCCAFTFINFCSFIMLPETPYFILQTKTEAEARDNLALFRAKNYNIQKEMAQLIDFKKENNLRKLSLKGSLGLLFSKASCKPFTLIMIYNLIAQAAGVSIILFWTTDLLQKTKSSFDVPTGNILMGVTRVVMGVFTSSLLYRYGRKPLAMLSAIGVTIVCCAFGLTLMTEENPSTTPLISLMVYVVFASLGYYTLPFLMAFELYPLQIRGILGGATISITSILIFATTKLEPFMLDSLGVANMFITFGLFSLIGCVFIIFWLPETKDLTLQEIEEYYKDKRPTLSSQRRLETLSQLEEFSGPSEPIKKIGLERLNDEIASRNNRLAQLEAQKKLAQLIEKEIDEQLRSSSSTIKVRSSQERKEEDTDQENTKSTDVKKYEESDRESVKSADSKKTRVISFDDESITSKKSADSKKAALLVIYEEKKDKDTPNDEKKKDKDTPRDKKKDKGTPNEEKKKVNYSLTDEKKDKDTPEEEKKKDKDTPKDEKKDKDTPKDVKRDEETPKDEKKDKDTPKEEKKKNKDTTKDKKIDEEAPKVEKKDKDTPKDVKRDEETLKDEKKDKDTTKDEKKDKDTPKDEKKDKDTPKDEKKDKDTPKDEKKDKDTPKDEKRDEETPKDEKKDKDTPIDEKKDKDTPKDEKRDEETPKDEKKDKDTPKDEKKDKDTPKDEKRDEETPKDEKKDKDTPKDEKKDKDTPKDEKRDEETPKDEKKDKDTPKDEKKDKDTPKDEKRDEETPKDEKKDKDTPKDEKRDEETPKDEDQPSTSKKNTQ